jgi:hypothetical protein
MKKTAALLSLSLLFSCGNSGNKPTQNQEVATDKAAEMTNGASNNATDGSAAVANKYDIKSGIVTYETKMEAAGMIIKSKKILYFDDYGAKECEEEYKSDAASGKEILKGRNFTKDGFHYIISFENKGGVKTKMRGTGVAAKFDMDEAASMKENKFVKLADETICGKSCNAFSMETPSGKITMSGWNRVTLKTSLAGNGIKSESTATKIEENASIPSDVFEVPKDMAITDM